MYDTETGMYYLNSRYYNPEWRRFINADATLGGEKDLLGKNMYAYCNNNPVNISDPSGEFGILATAIICGVVGAGISAIITAGMQYATTGKVNWKDVGVAAGVGFLAGALTPFVGTSTWGMIGLGATASVTHTIITNKVNSRNTSGRKIVGSAVVGGIAGGIGGKFSNLKGGYKPQTHYGGSIPMIPRSSILIRMEAREITRNTSLNALTNSITIRNFISGILSNGGAEEIGSAVKNRINIF